MMENSLYNKKNTLSLEKKLQRIGISDLLLMTSAGHNLYKIVKEKIEYEEIIVLAGPGNNGGDAISFAIQAKINGEKVSCISLSNHKNNSKKLFNFSKEIGLEYKKFSKNLFSTKKKLLLIDGIFGIGISRKPEGKIADVINFINNFKIKNKIVVSIDIPSGLNPDNGVAYSTVINANYTIMCLTRKIGCYTGDGLKYSGQLLYTSLNIKNIEKIQPTKTTLLSLKEKIALERDKLGHKGKFGNVLVLGGWDNMPGAANLASLAALRTGCGKVFVCSNNNKLSDEIIRVPNNIVELKKIINHIDVIVAGPGLGCGGDDVLEFLWKSSLPLVLDADGINWLAKNFKKKRKSLLIGTPHYGEAKRLLGKSFIDRILIIKKIKEKYGGRWILKGPGTLILNKNIYVNNFANSILATAGSGDVLAGIIGGLIAQNIKNPEVLGVQIHTHSANEFLKNGNKTIVASDLLSKISSSFYTL